MDQKEKGRAEGMCWLFPETPCELGEDVDLCKDGMCEPVKTKISNFKAANITLREKLEEREKHLQDALAETKKVESEVAQERAAHEQTRQLWKLAEKELIEIDDAFKRCGNPVGAHDTRPEKIANVLGANKCMAELLKERKGKA